MLFVILHSDIETGWMVCSTYSAPAYPTDEQTIILIVDAYNSLY